MKSKPIYIVGGVSRSGKTLIRERLLKKYGIEGISTDILQGVIDRRHTEWEEKYEKPDKLEHYWPYILSLIYYQAKYSTNGFCIEGDIIVPSILKTIQEDINFRAVFLGYKDVSVDDKYRREVSNQMENSWTKKLEEPELKNHIEGAKNNSQELEKQCLEFGYEYIDTSENFEEQLSRAEKVLVG